MMVGEREVRIVVDLLLLPGDALLQVLKHARRHDSSLAFIPPVVRHFPMSRGVTNAQCGWHTRGVDGLRLPQRASQLKSSTFMALSEGGIMAFVRPPS